MVDSIFQEFKFHHIGLLVKDMDEAIEHYTSLFGSENISEVYILESQNVKECFVQNSPDTFIGLVAPLSEKSVVHNMLKKGVNYYHLAYKVKDMQSAVDKLETIYYKTLTPFNSEAFNGNSCVFLYTPEGHLVELIEDKELQP